MDDIASIIWMSPRAQQRIGFCCTILFVFNYVTDFRVLYTTLYRSHPFARVTMQSDPAICLGSGLNRL